MKKGKSIIAGILVLAMAVSALFCTTPVYAADQVYTETGDQAGRVVKVKSDGTETDSFTESIMLAGGETAYCTQLGVLFEAGYKTKKDATTELTEAQITNIALCLEYVKQYAKEHSSITKSQKYLLEQCMVWRRLSVYLKWGYNQVRADYSEVSEKIQTTVYENALAFAKENKDKYECYGYIYVGSGQNLGQFFATPASGKGKVKKTSSNADISDGNSSYSLEGAVYTVYSDEACTNKEGTLTTNAKGVSDTIELPVGTYYVKEKTAPAGFKKDTTVYTLKITKGSTTTLSVTDEPLASSASIELEKIDMELQTGTPQGAASLAGAQFEWAYYNGFYTADNLPSKPTRTWVTQTVKSGSQYITALADAYKVSGDAFYTLNGNVVLPFGTITVKEKSAPSGYLLDGSYLTEKGQTKKLTGLYVAQITESSGKAVLSGGNQYSVSDQVIRGGVKIQKRDSETKGTTPQGNASLEGAQFAITSLNANPVIVNGKSYSNGQEVLTITTNASGVATTAANALPKGHYKIQEKTPPKGYTVNSSATVEFDITENGKIVDLTTENLSIYNQPVRGGVKIQKRDLETKNTQPQGSATFNKTTFQITSLNTNPIVISGKSYKNGEVVMSITSDESGLASTAADALPYGHYKIMETATPNGYLIDGAAPIEFDIIENGKIVDLTVENASIYNQVIRGGVKIQKRDSETKGTTPQGSAVLEGAQFTIISLNANPVVVNGKSYSNNQEVLTITTNAAGVATTEANTLPNGHYKIQEKTPPKGYLINSGASVEFDITVNGKIVDLTSEDLSIYNQPIRGGVKIQKRDFETKKAQPQGSATLDKTTFQITSLNPNPVLVDGKSYKNGEVVMTITSNESGLASTAADALPYGHYKIMESAAPYGYLIDGAAPIEFDITENGKIVDLSGENASIYNQVIRGGVKIQKRDLETRKTQAQGNATLENTQFSITTLNGNPVLVNGKLYEKDQVVMTIKTNASGVAATSADALPIGSYQISEVAPPKGYLDNKTTTIKFSVLENGKIVDLTAEDNSIYNQVIRGGVKIQKRDLETREAKAQGNATLENATFAITNLSHNPVLVNGELYEKDQVVLSINTDETGIASTAEDTLPYGHYRIDETKAPQGYLKEGNNSVEFDITENGVIVDLTGEAGSIYNQVIRGDLEFVKVSDGDLKRLADVPFSITSTTTGESHIIVTDRNGYANTAASWNKHTYNTNQGQTSEDGIWFGTSEPDDEKGALIYDTYMIEELRCESNKDMNLLKFEVTIYRDSTTVQLGTLTDDPIAIGTVARDKDTDTHFSRAEGKVTLVDEVEYTGLQKGTKYRLLGTLMDTATGEPLLIDDKPVTAETTFTARLTSGTTDVSFTFDASSLSGKTIVIFEDLYQNDTLVTSHADPENTDQTIYFPEIGTTLTDVDTDDHLTRADQEITLVDTVTYKNLVPGKEYEVTGTLMDKETGKAMEVDGKPITATVTFTPEETEGSVEITFTFDGSVFAGKTLVAFESLKHEGRELAVHADINDESQTVHIPEIHTTATDAATESHLSKAGPEVTINDVVEYKNLIPGKEYHILGTLIDKESGEPVLLKEIPVTAELAFTPEEPDGSVILSFTFDASALQGKAVVVFESLTYAEKEVAVHADITDEGQTVYFPEIGTTAKDTKTGDHISKADEKIQIIDTVTYSNLAPGIEYTVTGTLMDKETGEPLEKDGEPITSTATFTPEHPNGSVELTFTFDGTDLAGKSVVAFESVSYEDREVAVHADINDENQTVYIPEIGTTAMDEETGSHLSKADESITITDTVAYKNLIPGKEYTVTGTLMDKETGKALETGHAPVTASTVFTPEDTDGTVMLTFTIDGSMLAGKTLVAFESVSYGETEIAIHADLDDEGQTIHIPQIRTTAKDVETGSHQAMADNKVEIMDTVIYQNLIPEVEYTVTGTLMDKETGEALLVGGKPVTAAAIFTPEAADGSVEITFIFDGSVLAGKTVVAFESVSYMEKEVAVHADLEDKDQSIYFPQISTSAADKSDKDKELTAKSGASIVDTITYKNLTPGTKYKVTGTLMDKETGKAVEIDGKPVTGEASFKAKKADGTVNVTFTFDASSLGGHELVVFEKLFLADIEDGSPVATHEDINDEAQTVSVRELPKDAPEVSSPVQTGDDSPILMYVTLAGAALLVTIVISYYYYKNRKKDKKKH